MAAALLLAGPAACSRESYPRQALLPGADGIDFVDESTCYGCHENQHSAWTGSQHDRAMDIAGPETVLGDFNDGVFASDGDTVRFQMRDGRYSARLAGPDGRIAEFPIPYTFGIEPLQQYLAALPGGRLQALTIAWDTERGEWFDLYPGDRAAPGSAFHWSGRLERWNDRCAECHSTDLRVGYDTLTSSYRTTWAAIDVGCQACHGPGAEHVRLARADESSTGHTGLVAYPAAAGIARELDMCARCHARRSAVSASHQHGRSFFDDYSIALLREDLYYPDGQILDEVYVTGSFLQSLMYRRGVTCTNCHDPHTARIVVEGNQLCTRCHNEQPPAGFPTLRARDYDSRSHHHHEPGSAGSACVDCHMPTRNYMVVDPRRDHSIRIPRPDLSEALGTPNACTGCHVDRAPVWAVSAIDSWFRSPARPAHYGEAIAAARAGRPDAAERLIALAGDTTMPGIARATALDLLADHASRDAAVAIVGAIADPDPVVRLAAVNATRLLPAESRPPVLSPLLSDRVASIRIAAVLLLAPVVSRLDPAGAGAAERLLGEYRDAQLAHADQPESHHNLAELFNTQGRPLSAEEEFRKAIELDSAFVPARVNLAMLYNGFGRNSEAESLLREAIALAPELPDLHYSLGLLLAEMGRVDGAVVELKEAAMALPDRPRIHYNLGLALQRTGDMAGAEQELLRANAIAPDDPSFVVALVHFYRAAANHEEAVRFARRLAVLLPDDPGVAQLLDEVLSGR